MCFYQQVVLCNNSLSGLSGLHWMHLINGLPDLLTTASSQRVWILYMYLGYRRSKWQTSFIHLVLDTVNNSLFGKNPSPATVLLFHCQCTFRPHRFHWSFVRRPPCADVTNNAGSICLPWWIVEVADEFRFRIPGIDKGFVPTYAADLGLIVTKIVEEQKMVLWIAFIDQPGVQSFTGFSSPVPKSNAVVEEPVSFVIWAFALSIVVAAEMRKNESKLKLGFWNLTPGFQICW